MNSRVPSWREVLALAPGADADPALAGPLRALVLEPRTPWLLNVFAAIGAWWAAGFMQIFFGLLQVYEHAAACAVSGALALAGALALSRCSRHVFVSQFALATLLTGNGLLLGAVLVAKIRSETALLGLLTAVQAGVAAVTLIGFQGAVGRFLTAVAVPGLAAGWIVVAEQPHALHGLIAVLAALLAGLFLQPRRGAGLDAWAGALAVALPGVILLVELIRSFGFLPRLSTPLWPSSLAVALALLAVIAGHAGGLGVWRRRWFAWTAAALAVLAAFTTPGLLVALLLLFIGRAEADRRLSALGYAFLAGFLVLFYYALHLSLAQKSGIIAGTGLLLLLIGRVLGSRDGKEAAS